jgi:hypothetical protein
MAPVRAHFWENSSSVCLDRLRFVVGERAANTGHEGVRDGIGREIDVGRVRDTLGELLGVTVLKIVENGQGAADFVGE